MAKNYSIPGLMDLQTPRADEDATLVHIPEEGLPLAKLRATGARNETTVLHGDGVWRVPPPSGNVSLGVYPRGEAISGARCVYFKTVGGTTYAFRASATDPEKAAVAFVVSAGPEGEDVEVWTSAPIPGLSGVAVSAPYYLGEVGEFDLAPPAGAVIIQPIGVGVLENRILGRIGTPTYL